MDCQSVSFCLNASHRRAAVFILALLIPATQSIAQDDPLQSVPLVIDGENASIKGGPSGNFGQGALRDGLQLFTGFSIRLDPATWSPPDNWFGIRQWKQAPIKGEEWRGKLHVDAVRYGRATGTR